RPVPMAALDRQGQGCHQEKRAQTLLALGRITAGFSTSVINSYIIALRPKERLPQRRFGALQTACLSVKTLTEQWLRRCSHEERSTFLRRTVCQHRRAIGQGEGADISPQALAQLCQGVIQDGNVLLACPCDVQRDLDKALRPYP